jgi:transcriptional regulator with XRE-family HTH domain
MREECGLTQMQLAESLGITQSFVSKIERGERVVDVIQLREICHCLGTTLTKFVIKLERQLQKPPPSS